MLSFLICCCFFGFLFVWGEFLLPGAVLGVMGGTLLLLGCLIAAFYFTTWLIVFGFWILITCFLIVSIRWILAKMRKDRGKDSLYLHEDQEGFQAVSFDTTLVGKEGEAFSDLNPSGYISIEGVRYQAISESLYLEKGQKITVIGGRGAYLIVEGSSPHTNS